MSRIRARNTTSCTQTIKSRCFRAMVLDTPPLGAGSLIGLGRTAVIWGVPYMAMLVVVVASMFTGVLVAFSVGPGGLLFV
ncbi:hypothetical protein V4C53_47860, partial [Paraburkholderia azotifigens]